jgi:hypothetical protein
MGGGEVAPWWLAIASGIVLALTGAIGKLWAENRALRRENRELGDRLADANAHNAELQAAAFREHRRDLRVFAGLPTSGAPPPSLDPLRPPILIREAAPKRQRAAKKATE